MSKSKKVWLKAAAVFVAIGAAAFIGALASMGFDMAKLGTQKYKTSCYELSDGFENISIRVETADIVLVPSKEDTCKVECFEAEAQAHFVTVQDGTLFIDVSDDRKWYDYIGISFQTPKITIHLPKEEYQSFAARLETGNLELPARYRFETVSVMGTTSNIACYASVSESTEISTTTGNIIVGSSETERIRVSATSGSLTVKQVSCDSLTANNRTGKISLENVIAEDRISVESATGGVRFAECDGANIAVKTSTGSVKGTFLSDKTFAVSTATGHISVPDSKGGGRCEITTSTGDIKIEIR